LFWACSLCSLAILRSSTAAARILALDGIIGLMEEGVAVIDDGIVEVSRPDGFACWDYARVWISQLVISGNSVIK